MKDTEVTTGLESHKMTVFVEHEDGTYGPAESGSYMVKNFIDNFAEKQKHFHESAYKDLAAGKISPVGYHMRLREIAPADLAVRAIMPVGKVKKILDPKGFASLTIGEAARIADVLGIPLADLFQLAPPGMMIAHQPTPNQWVVRSVAIAPIPGPHSSKPASTTEQK